MPGEVPIVQSWHAVLSERVKRYPKRKSKSIRHWRRMDKKWLKRYGFRKKPAMFHMDVGAGKTVFVVHPTLMPHLQAALRKDMEAHP